MPPVAAPVAHASLGHAQGAAADVGGHWRGVDNDQAWLAAGVVRGMVVAVAVVVPVEEAQQQAQGALRGEDQKEESDCVNGPHCESTKRVHT